MPDNLTVEISANSGKLRADLTLLQKQLRDVRKDLTAAATAGDTSKVNELSLSYEKLSAQIRGTSRALSAQNRVVAESNTSYGRLASIVGDAGNALGSLIGMSGGLKTFFSVFTVVEGRSIAAAIEEVLGQYARRSHGHGRPPVRRRPAQEYRQLPLPGQRQTCPRIAASR